MTQPGAPTTPSRPAHAPLAVALGLVATGVRGARRLPFRAVQLPVLALNSALVLREGAKREYDELAERGEAVIARLRGRAGAGVQTGAVVASTAVDGVRGSVAGVVDKAQDLAGDAAARAAGGARGATREARRVVQGGVEASADLAADLAEGVEELADRVEDAAEDMADKAADLARGVRGDDGDPATTEPKGEATPSRDDTPLSRPDTAASADVVAVVEQVSEQLSTGEDVAHEDLPLPDYDHMTLGSLRGRMRSLTLEQLVVIRDYEKAHADRLPVVTMLDNRIAKLQTEGGTPSGTPATGTADLPPAAGGTGKVRGGRTGSGGPAGGRLGDADQAQSLQRDPRR